MCGSAGAVEGDDVSVMEVEAVRSRPPNPISKGNFIWQDSFCDTFSCVTLKAIPAYPTMNRKNRGTCATA